MRLRRMNAPGSPPALQRSASASSARVSLAENWRRRPIAKTSGSRDGAFVSIGPLTRRAPGVAQAPQEPMEPFMELFSDEVMCMSRLYAKLPETGVPHHIGTAGAGNRPAEGRSG